MAENIELIAAKDLPTTEAEEVSVLCIDNGELKQKPGASFGAGGGRYVAADTLEMGDDGVFQGVINENYDNFIGILLAGGTVWIDMAAVSGNTEYTMATMWGFVEGVLTLGSSLGGMQMVFICPNGSWTPEG